MICPRCQSQVADGVKFCGVCGSPMQVSQTPPPQAQPQSQYGAPAQGAYIPPNQYEEYSNNQAFGSQVPRAELHNPKGPLHVADMTITIDGQLVPVVDVMLGNQLSIYFEHHILLWKHPGVQIGFKSLRGMAKRFFAGLQVFMTEAQGPGNISFSRDSVGQIVALRLQPGQLVEVREHQFLFATSNVDYGFTFMQGAANILFSRTGLFIDQFTCRGLPSRFTQSVLDGEGRDAIPPQWCTATQNTVDVVGQDIGHGEVRFPCTRRDAWCVDNVDAAQDRITGRDGHRLVDIGRPEEFVGQHAGA